MNKRWNAKGGLIFDMERIVVVLAVYGMVELLQVGDAVTVG